MSAIAASSSVITDGVYRVEQGMISIGRVFRVFGSDNSLVAYVKHPLLKLRDEFNIFADEEETRPLLTAKAQKLVQLNTTYVLSAADSGSPLLTVQRRALRSMWRDRLELLDNAGQPVGSLDEIGFALARRFIKWLPRHWTITVGGAVVAKVDQRFTLLRKVIDVDLTPNQGRLDPRAAIACVLMLLHEVKGAA